MDWTHKQPRASAKEINLIVCSVVQFQFDGMYAFFARLRESTEVSFLDVDYAFTS